MLFQSYEPEKVECNCEAALDTHSDAVKREIMEEYCQFGLRKAPKVSVKVEPLVDFTALQSQVSFTHKYKICLILNLRLCTLQKNLTSLFVWAARIIMPGKQTTNSIARTKYGQFIGRVKPIRSWQMQTTEPKTIHSVVGWQTSFMRCVWRLRSRYVSRIYEQRKFDPYYLDSQLMRLEICVFDLFTVSDEADRVGPSMSALQDFILVILL